VLYRQMGKTGDKVSILGYGCMRFPKKGRGLDEERASRQLISAIEQGINYFDTAHMYNNGRSESILGKTLAQGYRDKVKIATKMHPLFVHTYQDMENIIDHQLKRLQTDHIDYYLMHSMINAAEWKMLQQLGVEQFIEKARQSGKIGRIGFSYHGQIADFKKIVDDYAWDFCQIQYNYMDEHHQAGTEGLRYAAAKGLGVVIMEPLRGGHLVGKMPDSIKSIWDKAEIKRTPAEWALRWVWNHPEVSIVLSGMNEESHIAENIRIANEALPLSLSNDDLKIIDEVKLTYKKMIKIGCTGCNYCMPCPSGVNIPFCFNTYNSLYLFNEPSYRFIYLGFTGGMEGGKPSYASLCRNCGKCEEKCPQRLPIRQHLEQVSADMERFYFKPAVKLVQGYHKITRFFKRSKKTASETA
jgi:uncharacterized protein